MDLLYDMTCLIVVFGHVEENTGASGSTNGAMVPSKRPGETTPTKVTKLRRLGNFNPELVESETTKTIKPEDIKEAYKYGIIDTPAFISEVSKWVADEAPPVYHTQGEDIGRTRGRKPGAGKKNETGKTKKNGKGGKKGKGKRATKGKNVKKGAKKGGRVGAFKKLAMTKTDKSPLKRPLEPTPPAKGVPPTAPKDDPTPKDVEQEGPVHHGAWRAPPSHVKYNGIYSSAYRKNLIYGADFARAAGQLAGQTWRRSGFVDDLCGVFREAPRAKKTPPTVDADTE